MTRLLRVFAIVAIIGLSLPHVEARAQPTATQGFLDLSNWHFDTAGTIELAGEWEFYWHQLISPADFAIRAPAPDGWLKVPGAWNGYTIDDEKLPAVGYGTFRLQVRLREANQRLALYIPFEQTAYRMWINQTLVASNGIVADNAAETVPQLKPTVVRFTPTEPTIDIVFEIANYSHRVGGMWNAPVLGLEAQIDNEVTQRLLISVLLLGGFVFLALYHATRFALRPSDRSSIVLGVLGLLMAIRTALMGDIPIVWLLHNIPWEWHVRIEYATGFGVFALFALSLCFLFPQDASRLISRIAATIGTASALLSLVTPVLISSRAIPLYLIVVASFLLYFLYIAFRAFLRNCPGGLIKLIGVSLLIVTALLDFLYYNRYYGRTDWMPFGFFIFVIALTFHEARQYASALRQKEALVTELQASRRLLASLEERQRQEVAEFLHSRVQARLALLSHQTTQVARLIKENSDQAIELLEKIQEGLIDVQENDIRRASHRLHPSVVASGLIPAIQALAEQYVDVLNIAVNADEKITCLDRAAALGAISQHDNYSIRESNRLCVYRIVEEWLANIHKHAIASQVSIKLEVTKQDELMVSLTDDGIGFDPKKVPTGLGLRIIEARILEEGGTMHIETSPNRGTTITVRFPLNDATRSTRQYISSSHRFSGGMPR